MNVAYQGLSELLTQHHPQAVILSLSVLLANLIRENQSDKI